MTRMLRNERMARRNSLLSLGLPILVAGTILLIVLKAFFSEGTDSESRGGADSVTVLPKSENSEIYLYMSGDSKKKLEGEEKMYPTDNRLEVKSGDADLTIEGSQTKLSADRLTEIAYRGRNAEGKHAFELLSSYVWVEANAEDTVFKLKNLTVTPKAGSVAAFSQNAVGSNVYVLKGRVAVATEASNTEVGVNQMVGVLSSEAATVKLPEAIRPIDSFFRTENVYLKHGGDAYLLTEGSATASGTSASGSAQVSGTSASKPIVFTNPEDESSVETQEIDIEGTVVHPNVAKVTINDKETKLDAEKKTFSFKGFPLSSNRNDLVWRAFDADGNLVPNAQAGKGFLTVYSSAKKAADTASKPTVTTYPISDKEFRIVAPAENPYKTTENVVRIEGRLPKGSVKQITVNGFRLTKFTQYGTYWYYFANKDYGTMNDGINTYEIRYYGENDELLKTSQLIIVKEAPAESAAPTSAPEEKTPGTVSPAPVSGT